MQFPFKPIVISVFLFTIFIGIFISYVVPDSRAELSPVSVQLLDKIRAENIVAKKKIKSGIIECTLTFEETPRRKEGVSWPPKNPKYEILGTWDITFRFTEGKKNFRITENTTVDLHGYIRPKQGRSIYEFQVSGTQKHGRVNKGKGWLQISELPPFLESHCDPRFWADHFQFNLPPKNKNVLEAQHIDTDGEPFIYVKFQREDLDVTHRWADKVRTTELWIHSQKDYRVTKGIVDERHPSLVGSDNTDLIPDVPFSKDDQSSKVAPVAKQVYYAAQLVRFNPDIWFPQTATEEWKIVSAGKTPVPYYPSRKITMQVHRAVFNIPIDEKEMRVQPNN